MDAETRQAGQEAIRRLEAVIAAGPDVTHEAVHLAVTGVAAFRNRLIDDHRRGGADRACLDAANGLVSLGYGAEFPLTGFHLRRFQQARDGLKSLIGAG